MDAARKSGIKNELQNAQEEKKPKNKIETADVVSFSFTNFENALRIKKNVSKDENSTNGHNAKEMSEI